MGVREGICGYCKLLETNDSCRGRGIRPGVVFLDLTTGTGTGSRFGQPQIEVRYSMWMDTYALYSSISKILCGSFSTATSKPASMSFLAVVGVKAARFSNGLVSHLNQTGILDVIVTMG